MTETEAVPDLIAAHNERVKMRANFMNALSIGLIGFAFLRPLAEGQLFAGWHTVPLPPDNVEPSGAELPAGTVDFLLEMETHYPTPNRIDQFLYQAPPFSGIFEWVPMWTVWVALGVALHFAAQRPLRKLKKEVKK
ncbi:hypothetical protein ACFOHK_08890 [Falsigemmobacter intermedius]|uniref:Uncharacterized protein n=1 Tax=Falsigemmobacter intermedius TaxID=1553448 RepID=A0A451GHS4_9RHOB|nr:hypothetical protein [Falsigemmobacter intermedius]RWY38514.1 hypothetical protein EP867_16015 [Falsigemmobacter intermedius]